ncbi:MAG: DUF3365 domain-containing protein [Saprospiraceae bacterium]|nr:DUF3365 domain-containing protein [Saprospiraceae bacterium]
MIKSITPVLTFAAIIIGLITSCESQPTTINESESTAVAYNEKEGLAIVSQNCISCHAPVDNAEKPVAPSLKDIKAAYYSADIEKEAFISSVAAFLANPNPEKSQMPVAVEAFGIMPNLGMSENQYKSVAAYLYQSNIDDPAWYETVFLKEKAALEASMDTAAVDYLEKGMQLALATKAVLGKNLLNAIQTKGTAEALSFCNTRAEVLTDSMATQLGAKIKRVSDKNRNPDNAANAMELAYINEAKAAIASSGKAKPQIHELGDKMIGYYPIMTNNMCLQCHGNTTQNIDPVTKEKIATLYPADKATGYGENELRGIWVVEMEN